MDIIEVYRTRNRSIYTNTETMEEEKKKTNLTTGTKSLQRLITTQKWLVKFQLGLRGM